MWFWLAGAIFTDGLVDPRNVDGFWIGFKRLGSWPYELAEFVLKWMEDRA